MRSEPPVRSPEPDGGSPMKRIVVVADNPMIVAAIRTGVRECGALELIGYADPMRATAERIVAAGADAVLVDEADGSELTLALIRALREADHAPAVIVLAVALESEWVRRALEAGAGAAISKAVHPAALATLIREALAGHIFHAPRMVAPARPGPRPRTQEHASLTDREREILRMVSSGATNSVIARELWITQQTVKFHVSNIYRKLGVANRTEACHYAHVNGIADEPAAAPTASVALAVAS